MKIGDFEGALRNIVAISKIINDHGYCSEVITPRGKEVKLVFWNSEKQIAWTAGMYIYACSEAEKLNIL